MTGAELRALRKAAGLSQATLARRAAIGRHAVSYWECRQDVDLRGWAVRRMLLALGVDPLPVYSRSNARARAWGLIQNPERARFEALVEARPTPRGYERPGARRVVGCGAGPRRGRARPAATKASRANGDASFTEG